MSTHDLKVTSRAETGKEAAKRLRNGGRVPAVAYGHKEEPVKLALNARELRDLLAHGHGRGLLTLKYEDNGGSDIPAIIKDLQRHPVSHAVIAVDFLRVSMDEKVKMSIPVVLEGVPDAVRVEGGVLVQALHELQVEALPQDLPEHITVDVTGLEFNGAPIHVREVTLPTGVVAVTDGDEAIAVVNPPEAEAVDEESTPEEEAAAAEGEAEAGDQAEQSDDNAE